MKRTYYVFDIGGTNTRFAVSRDGKKIDRCLVAPTVPAYSDGLKVVAKLFTQLQTPGTTPMVAGGVAGTFNKTKTQTLDCPQLPGWVGRPLRRDLEKIFHHPVKLENDAALGGLGEATLGAGRGSAIVGYVTIGTEVGGARIVDRQIDRMAFGFEPGKQLFLYQHRQQSLEKIIGGRAILQRFKLKPENITDQKVWRELREYVALGLRNVTALWSPDVLVLGGSVMHKLWPVPVRARVRSGLVWPKIKRGKLGDQATLIGGLAWLAQARN